MKKHILTLKLITLCMTSAVTAMEPQEAEQHLIGKRFIILTEKQLCAEPSINFHATVGEPQPEPEILEKLVGNLKQKFFCFEVKEGNYGIDFPIQWQNIQLYSPLMNVSSMSPWMFLGGNYENYRVVNDYKGSVSIGDSGGYFKKINNDTYSFGCIKTKIEKVEYLHYYFENGTYVSWDLKQNIMNFNPYTYQREQQIEAKGKNKSYTSPYTHHRKK